MKKEITKTVYTIDNHPNKSKVFKWVRDNWTNLSGGYVSDLIKTVKAIACAMNCDVHYAILTVSDQNEFIKFTKHGDGNVFINKGHLELLIKQSQHCSFTGHGNDHLLSESLRLWDGESDIKLRHLSHAFQSLALDSIHDQTEHVYSDEGLNDYLDSNEFYFNKDGSFYE